MNSIHIYRGAGIWCSCGMEYVHESKYKLICPNCGSIYEIEPNLWDLFVDLRELRKLSKAELARRAGVSTSTIYKIENQQVMPSKNTVLKLVKALEGDKETFLKKRERAIEANKLFKD